MQRNQHLYGMMIIISVVVSSTILVLPLCTLCSQSGSNKSFWLGLAMGKFYNLLHTRLCILCSISIIHGCKHVIHYSEKVACIFQTTTYVLHCYSVGTKVKVEFGKRFLHKLLGYYVISEI